MIWDMVEIAASAVENIIIVDFVGKYLGYKNQKIIWLKSGLFFVLSMMNVIIVPAVFHSEIVSAVILRQYRTKIVRVLRSQIFRQIVQ